MKLYELNNRLEAILNQGEFIDHETGKILDNSDLDNLELTMAEKVEGTLCYIKEQTALATALKAEADALAKRAKTAKAKAERTTAYLAHHVKGQEFSTARAELKWRKSTKVEITDFKLIPLEYTTTKTTTTADKTAIKAELKKGVEISGAKLDHVENPQLK